ncbi:putative membrane protein YdjX (TVP38/TMEM64 family) [Alkalispirillum mobile]|uniref:TVP38/TMEM64 family membrane protein n=1 Tax=Alkalispirillum mobile TaxID=85925 RepID=A0A498BX76_9GAMM|nr:VTT domain-containing protein [Alkalispirillum mobile]RLK48294.1 putative membrane protein YdjX (TVP38/TMEM64 family) [Alkalispirillum mobile]
MTRRRRALLLVAGLLGLILLALLWALLSPGAGWQPERLEALGRRFADAAWFPWAVFALVLLTQQLAVPHLLLIALAVLLLGFWQGFLVAYAATVAGASVGYVVGRLFGQDLLERYSGPRLERLNRALARRGVAGAAVANLFPVLPHTLINLAAGTTRVAFRHFMLGTAIGLFPSTLVIALITQVLLHFARMPTATEAFVALLATGVVALALWLVGRRVWQRMIEADQDDP